MPKEYLTKKSTPSSAGEAASGVFGKHRAARQGKASATKTGKGHFAAAAQRIAKLRSGVLQHGVPKRAPLGGPQVGKSGIVRKMDAGQLAQASEAQSALNPKQQGATKKKAQTGRGNSE